VQILKAIWEWWKPIGHRIGNFQARVVLTLFYFVGVMPFAIGVLLLSDPLGLKAGRPVRWIARPADDDDALTLARRQF